MPLECFFQPCSLAVIGATDREGSVGRAVLENLRAFPGRIFAVNAKRDYVLDRPSFASLSALPEVPDLVLIMTPAAKSPALVEEAGKLGVKAVVVMSAGFKETGVEGAKIEAEVIAAANRHSRLESRAKHGLQRLRLHRRDGGLGLGRFHPALW
ncbi:MAG: CoA-binding protein [Prosthecobacter sp.]